MIRHLLTAFSIALALLAGACATPYVDWPGPAVTQPALNSDHVLTADGEKLPLRAFLPDVPPRAAILALHGFNDYSNAFAGPGRFFASQGIAFYAYDQRSFGHAPNRGLWPGAETLAADAVTALDLVRRRHPGVPVYLLGESMGGAVAMLAATRVDLPIEGLVLVAPAVWGRAVMNVFERVGLWFFANTFPDMTVTGAGLKIMASDNIEMLRAFSRDPLVIKATRWDSIHGLVGLMDEALAAAPKLKERLLLLYGEKDEVMPKGATFRMASELPRIGRDQRGVLYQNGWHMLLRDLQAQVVLDDILAWIHDPAGPLPSGAEQRFNEALAKEMAD
jgi:alpha-beta hydrolase superfamily lysophospholipase